MDALYFLLGLLVRFAFLLVVLLAAALPVVLGVGALRLAQRLRARRLGLVKVGPLTLAEAHHYAPGHTWLSGSARRGVRVGVDELAQHLLPYLSSVSLPAAGTHLAAGAPAATLRSGGRSLTVAAPVAGTVVRVNDAVAADPGLVAAAPYTRGWLFAMKPESASYLTLPSGEAARRWFRTEEARLSRFVEGELGLAAADGGEPPLPAPALLPDDKWRALASAMLG